MVTDAQLKASLRTVLKGKVPAADVADVERIFRALARIAPNCMADSTVAGGFIETVLKENGLIGPHMVAEVAAAEKLLRGLKTQPVGVDDSLSLPEQLDRLEKYLIERALEMHRRKGDAAKALGIPQSTLSTKLKKLGLRE